MKQIEKQTIESFSFLWNVENKNEKGNEETHFEIVQNVLNDEIVSGGLGLEVGCGPGYDIEYMATKYPDKKFVAIDFSFSVFLLKKRLKGLNNIQFIRASALELPFKDGLFDFVYSFGVLHHTANPVKGFAEINRVLKQSSKMVLYLYENHEDNRAKYYILKLVSAIRCVTTNIPNGILYAMCVFASPIVYLLFSVPAKVLNKFRKTRLVANKIPFNFGRHPFGLIGDLFDRFKTPIEKRYGKEELTNVLSLLKFEDVKLAKITDTAGWVVKAVK